MKVEGSCLCGEIAYEGEAQPGTIILCHCGSCQQQTGSVFRTNVPVPAESFRILKGEPRIYIKTADSGNKRAHAFCGTCGGPIYATDAVNPTRYSLRVGALKQKHELGEPARQIWTKRRFPWLCELDEIPAMEGQP